VGRRYRSCKDLSSIRVPVTGSWGLINDLLELSGWKPQGGTSRQEFELADLLEALALRYRAQSSQVETSWS